MHLAQHHFQTQSRYFEDATSFALSTLFLKPYGLLGCEMDHDALRNGTVAVLHARGVLPDGLTFHFPDDGVPAPLEIADIFSPTQDAHDVLLVIPAYRPGGINCVVEPAAQANGTRYRAELRSVPDETSGEDSAQIAVARKNFRLVLEGAAEAEDWVSVPIARVRRDGSGRFIYDPRFIPPSLHVGASIRLLELVQRLVELLEGKAEDLLRQRSGTALRDYAGSEIASFWLSHAVNTSVAPLRQHLEHRSAHPERLFLDLARLAGALCTFSLDAHPRELPLYDHDRPEAGFELLDRHIRDHLEVALPTRCVPIPLTPREPSFFAGAVPDARSFRGAAWYLGVRAKASRADVISRVSGLVKVCSEKFIAELVRRGMGGLRLEHTSAPPAAISPRVGTEYFRVETAGPCWDSVVDTGVAAAYVPAALPEAELELLIALEE